MKRHLSGAILVLLLVAGYGRPGNASDAVGESLEWMVISRPHIAIEEVTSTTLIDTSEINGGQLKIETRLKETLKGQPPQQASFVRRWIPTEKPGQGDLARPLNGTPYLLFFNNHGDVTNAINLKYPSRKQDIGADPSDVAVAVDFAVLKSGDAILDVVRRRLDLIAKRAAVTPAGTAPATENPKKVEVPIDRPAWDIFYDGGSCSLLVPDDRLYSMVKSTETAALRTATFSGPALIAECQTLPRTAFEIKPVTAGQPHALTITCTPYPTPEPDLEKLTLTFEIYDVLRDADYDFQWDVDPDSPPPHTGFFGGNKKVCEKMASVLQFRAPGIVPLVNPAENANENKSPMMATWRADCVANESWGFVLVFELSVRSADPSLLLSK